MLSALYEAGTNGHWVFLLVTIVLGGATAFVSGKAIAETWRPYWQIFVYMILIALTVRFLHFALFEEVLVSAQNFVVDYIIVTAAALLGHKIARSRQMTTQYHWIAKS